MARIILVRHGETIWNVARRFQGQSDIDLNEKGRWQAGMTGKYLAGERIDVTYASDLVRCVDTAKLIVDGRGLEIVTRRDLRELDFGEWEGLTGQEISERYPGDLLRLRDEGWRPPRGETWPEMCARVLGAFEAIKRQHPDDAVLIVTHVNPLRVILADALRMSHEELFRTRLGNCAVNILDVNGSQCDLVVLNDTHHLEEASAS